jgi:hypothetical protein
MKHLLIRKGKRAYRVSAIGILTEDVINSVELSLNEEMTIEWERLDKILY